MRMPERSQLPENLEIPGLYPRRRRRLPNWPIGLWLVVIAVAAIPAVGIPAVALAHYTTSNSNFCLTCHSTGETPDRGVPSDVHPNLEKVTCVDCHAKPGQIVFEGYVKGFQAEPERVASNCVRCHSGMTQRTDQQGFKFNLQDISINHQAHVDRGVSCVTCHSNVAHDLETPKTNRPQMQSCYSCHSKSDSCTKCHGSTIPQPAPSRETVGRRPAAAKTAPSEPGQGMDQGKSLFAQVCAGCHGTDGSALPTANLKSKSYLEAYGAEALVHATLEGKGGMPAFGSAKAGPLDDGQGKAVIDYLLAAAN